MNGSPSGWSLFGVALLILVATALVSAFLRRRGHAYPDVHDRSQKAQDDRPLAKAAIAEPRGVIIPRLPLTQNEYEQSDMQQEKLGPRGVPGEKFPFGMTPERRKKTPVSNDPGHTA
jgi:hypothetical protein